MIRLKNKDIIDLEIVFAFIIYALEDFYTKNCITIT